MASRSPSRARDTNFSAIASAFFLPCPSLSFSFLSSRLTRLTVPLGLPPGLPDCPFTNGMD